MCFLYFEAPEISKLIVAKDLNIIYIFVVNISKDAIGKFQIALFKCRMPDTL